MAVLGRGRLANQPLCSPDVCDESPEFCVNGKKVGPIFECDFLSPVGEALDRVVGIIDAVQEIEVNKIRPQNLKNCVLSNELLKQDIHQKWKQKYRKLKKQGKSDEKIQKLKNDIEEYVQDQNDQAACFIIEYAVQVNIESKLVNGQTIIQSLDDATELLLEYESPVLK